MGKPKTDYSRYTEEQVKAMKAQIQFSDKALDVTFTKPYADFEELPGFDFIVQCYQVFKNGHMPHPGSFIDQPNKLIECFNVINALQNEEQTKEMKKQEQLRKKK